jgi:uncharacterized protein (DUF3820 family)
MPSFTELELKLVRLALDRSAPPGEAEAAMRKLLASLRQRGVDGYSELFMGAGSQEQPRPPRPRPQERQPDPGSKTARMGWPFSIPVTFGKHRGKYLGDLPSDYMDWCIKEFDPITSKALIEAMQLILSWRTEQIRKGNFGT